MEKRLKQARQIDDIINGKLAVPDADKDVQTWFELTVYNLALAIVDTPKEKRKAQAKFIKEQHPAWADDVLELARELCTK